VAGDFKQFEHEGWQRSVEQYDASFTRLTQQVFEPVLNALGVQNGTRLLDVACGPGHLCAFAHQRRAQVTGIDFSEDMIAKARQYYPGITFQEADAENLKDFLPHSFEAVSICFGILHFDRRREPFKRPIGSWIQAVEWPLRCGRNPKRRWDSL
jgi:ubiquinone/menaquinone biosynthesis C-methylase UbiE